MGAPDPHGVEVDVFERYTTVQYHIWRESNPTTRKARAMRILRLIGSDGEGWRCRWCRDYIPLFRRTDARYCCERCRKAAARSRRSLRSHEP